jgi:HAMP domain-containing protein
MDTLIDSFMRLRAEAKQRMTEEEFRRAEEEFNEMVNSIRRRVGNQV